MILENIRKFEKDYPKPSVQQEATPYIKNLQQYVEQCNTSSLLYNCVQEELKKMPYWFSKVGYLVISLRELLKVNNQEECLDTDEREKEELISAQEHLSQSPITTQTELIKQLQREQAKNKIYLENIDKVEAEKIELLSKLNAEIDKSLAYNKRIEELLTQSAELTKDQSKDWPDNQVIEELQQFVQTLMKENSRLSTDIIAINNKYIKALENNRILQEKYRDLDNCYQALQTQINAQNRLFNNKLTLAQDETKKMREDFEKRITQLERSKVNYFNNQNFSKIHLHKTSPINTSTKRNHKTNIDFGTQPNVTCEKLSW